MRTPFLNKLQIVYATRPPRNWLLLCFVSLFVLIALLGSEFDSVSGSGVKVEVYTNYRRLKEQAVSDYNELKSFGSRDDKVIGLCGRDKEHYVPCYNVSDEEFDRHCEGLSRDEMYCLVRAPRDYRSPLSWPVGRDVIWNANVKISKDQFLSSGSMTKRLMLLEENQISFHSDDDMIFDGVKDHLRQVAEMIGLGSDAEFWQAGLRTVLDVGCGFGSFGAHLLSLKVMAVCMAAYELTGSQVQLSFERGLPAIIGNFLSKKLPFPSLSYDMIHCAQCGVQWDKKDGMFLIEADRILNMYNVKAFVHVLEVYSKTCTMLKLLCMYWRNSH